MSSDNYVAMAKNICIVCRKKFDSGEILLHKQLRTIKEEHTLTGWGVCPEHQAIIDDDYILLIAIDPKKSDHKNGVITPESAYHTGATGQIKRRAWEHIFDVPPPEKSITYVDDALLEHLSSMAQNDETNPPTNPEENQTDENHDS